MQTLAWLMVGEGFPVAQLFTDGTKKNPPIIVHPIHLAYFHQNGLVFVYYDACKNKTVFVVLKYRL